MPLRRPPRLRPECYIGAQRVFLTMCTFRRARVFDAADTVAVVRDQLLQIARATDVAIHASCFMPDHLHLLVAGTSEHTDIRACADRFRRQSAFHFWQRHVERLWQEGYFDRVLRREEPTSEVVKYILANPVRAGLCREPADYAFSGSDVGAVADVVRTLEWK